MAGAVEGMGLVRDEGGRRGCKTECRKVYV